MNTKRYPDLPYSESPTNDFESKTKNSVVRYSAMINVQDQIHITLQKSKDDDEKKEK